MICGPTGSGKTVFIGFLVAMLARQGVTQVIFDKDRGLEILVRALGGEYLPLRNGVADRIQSAAAAADAGQCRISQDLVARARSRPHARRAARRCASRQIWIRRCAERWRWTRGAAPVAADRISGSDGSGGMHARLARWCERRAATTRGYSTTPRTPWPRARRAAVIGFDVTEFLDHALTRSPVTLYLFHLVRQLLDGRRLVCWMDEFWRLLADPAFESFAKDGPEDLAQAERRHVPGDAERSDVLDSPISRTIIEQTPTKVFFPNADASAEEYTEGFGLTRARVQAHQRAARARFAHVPGEAGASQRRLPARSARVSTPSSR